jgi:hypothetical protein
MVGRKRILRKVRDRGLSSLKGIVDVFETEDTAERRLTGVTQDTIGSSFPMPLEVVLDVSFRARLYSLLLMLPWRPGGMAT